MRNRREWGVKQQRRCRAPALQTGLSSCATIWATIAPSPTLTQKQRSRGGEGRGGGQVVPSTPHTPGAQKPREGGSHSARGARRGPVPLGRS